ncbi:hypothetical protein J6590_005372 [Homalodisca vitripennis]|nr:hypothetical protein J6590_005372 [Homalodisca vitripennis]
MFTPSTSRTLKALITCPDWRNYIFKEEKLKNLKCSRGRIACRHTRKKGSPHQDSAEGTPQAGHDRDELTISLPLNNVLRNPCKGRD